MHVVAPQGHDAEVLQRGGIIGIVFQHGLKLQDRVIEFPFVRESDAVGIHNIGIASGRKWGEDLHCLAGASAFREQQTELDAWALPAGANGFPKIVDRFADPLLLLQQEREQLTARRHVRLLGHDLLGQRGCSRQIPLFVGIDGLMDLAVDGHQVLGIISSGMDRLPFHGAAQISQTPKPGCLVGGDRAAGDIRFHVKRGQDTPRFRRVASLPIDQVVFFTRIAR